MRFVKPPPIKAFEVRQVMSIQPTPTEGVDQPGNLRALLAHPDRLGKKSGKRKAESQSVSQGARGVSLLIVIVIVIWSWLVKSVVGVAPNEADEHRNNARDPFQAQWGETGE